MNSIGQMTSGLAFVEDIAAGFPSEQIMTSAHIFVGRASGRAVFGAEAIESVCYMPNKGSGMILACGNGSNDLIAAQIRIEENGERFVRIFTDATTTEWFRHGTQLPSDNWRVVFRLERLGSEGRIFCNRGGAHQTPEFLFSTNIVGTNYLTFDSELSRLRNYRTGVVLPNANSLLARVRWWQLQTE